MNKQYRLIWNEFTQAWVAVAENARARGKRASGAVLVAAAGLAIAAASTSVGAAPPNPPTPPAPTQLPTGGQVVAGQAAISQSAATLTINQTSSRAALDWNTFNIGSQARVNFNQPSASSVTLNRVLDSNPSQIFGQINANGQVFISNPSGVTFAPGSSVDVGGLVATTHSISNADFMAGSNSFSRNGATGSVVNEGTLTADLNGYIALLAPEVRNSGVVLAQMGTVAMAAGEAYDLQFVGNRLTHILVTPATMATLVDNSQAVLAPGGLIILSAQAANRLQGGVINNSGSLEANGLVDNGGTIRLQASDQINQSGSIHADAAPSSVGNGGNISLIADLSNPDSVTRVSGNITAKGGSLGGNGGQVETSGAHLKVADGTVVDTSASLGLSGTWLLDPTNFTISSGTAAQTTSGIGATTLQTSLGTSNVSITTSATANGSDLGDINVNAPVTWTKNKLTLTAANNINVNAVMTAGATDNTGIAGTYAVLDLVTPTYNIDTLTPGGQVLMGMGSSGFSGQINFVKADGNTARSGSNFLTINGTGYTVINSLGNSGSTTGTDLQGMNGGLSTSYALGSNIDASASSGWANNFVPIGNGSAFSGNFNGLGHTIGGLIVKGKGLFSAQVGTAQYSGIQQTDVTVPNVISNVGLVGGSVTSTTDKTGGLVGYSSGIITNVFNSGMSVTSTGSQVGGLVGWGYGSITNSYSTGNVSGVSDVGGLVGFLEGTVNTSYANGDVTKSSSNAGGLVGVTSRLNSDSRCHAMSGRIRVGVP